MASQINFVIDQGTSFDAIADIVNDDGTPFDMTGFVGRGQFKKSYYSNTFGTITVNIFGDPINGQLELIVGPDETEAIRAGRYVYDVIVEDVSINRVKRVLQGILTIGPAVTNLTI